MERIADYIINRLTQNGINHIFMLTGRGILYLTDAVAKNKDIEPIMTYHEQGASYAAMAYASARDGMSACLVSTGCAATNAVTAALCTFQDNLPVVFISGNNMLDETTRHTGAGIRTYGSQETDIISVVESVTKYAVMLENPEDVAFEIDKALYMANEGRKGPVWIDIPLDIQNARIDEKNLRRFVLQVEEKSLDIENRLVNVVDCLNNANRPIVLVGGGLRSSGALEVFGNWVKKINIPVVFSTSAADAYGTGNELSIGAIGSIGGSRAGNFAIQNADYILAIGTKLCTQSIGDNSGRFARNAKLSVVDIDPNEHHKNGVEISNLIIADAFDFVKKINCESIKQVPTEWVNKCKHWKEFFSVKNEEFIKKEELENQIDLYKFADEISSKLSDDAAVITDAGLEELIIPSTIKFRQNQRCLFPASQGAMGYAIPAIIGTYFAGKRNIITVVGDGSIMMNIQELAIIHAYNIPVKIFVINNNMYAVIRKRQHDLFRSRTIGTDPSDGVPAPDFSLIAKCFGFEFCKISNLSELTEGIDKVLSSEGQVLCEVMCVPEQKYFHTSYAINEYRKLVKRPLEDMSPFLDRNVMKSEMIVPMIPE